MTATRSFIPPIPPRALPWLYTVIVAVFGLCASVCDPGKDNTGGADAEIEDVAQEVIPDTPGGFDAAPPHRETPDLQIDTPDPDAATADTAESGLPTGIFELTGFDPWLSLDDLAPLGGVIGDAPVVALGESIHTSKGYYQAKHRLFRYLVEVEGFRVLAFETYWGEGLAVSHYVDTCEGDPVELVKESLIYSWAGQSVADLIQWMCQYNQTHPDDPVQFFGFDIQEPWWDGPALMAFLELAALDEAETFNAGISHCSCTLTSSWSECKEWKDTQEGVLDEDHAQCLEALDEVEAWLEENHDVVVQATSQEQLGRAMISIVAIRSDQNKIYHAGKGEWGAVYESRDWGMSWVFNKLRSMYFPDVRVAIWAHDWHIAYRTDLMTEPAVPPGPIPIGSYACKGMGTFLHEQLGEDYFAIGLHAYKLAINWEGLKVGDLDLPSAGSLEGLLHGLGRYMLLVDLAFPGADAPFLEPGTSYGAGVFDGSGGLQIPIVPAEQYGAVVFLDDSPMMDALLW